ncbi:2-amino-4-hydroxy-6-hydroxymethyldihydropteridine diphosphokinase [Algivirga pacifica]|uniref:2-amino-4-hydroxy-6-hydroxymethyldihydropteridine pyrophosphokinase n=1 Tax=Algivirga pacifica TaxID=1162670 RepID=A0ABP9DLT3_9BACT
MVKVFLLLGGNMGDRLQMLQRAKETLEKEVGSLLKASSVYETAAWGKTDQPSFYNQVLFMETALSPQALLETVLGVEQALGRERLEKWGARLIDIDILFYDNQQVDQEHLKIPHPFIQERRFTLEPLCELDKDWVHPVFDKTLKTLLEECQDTLPVMLVEG